MKQTEKDQVNAENQALAAFLGVPFAYACCGAMCVFSWIKECAANRNAARMGIIGAQKAPHPEPVEG
jgi:hypothetical protein